MVDQTANKTMNLQCLGQFCKWSMERVKLLNKSNKTFLIEMGRWDLNPQFTRLCMHMDQPQFLAALINGAYTKKHSKTRWATQKMVLLFYSVDAGSAP